MSHFIEHMLFKGTKSRTAKQISQDVEGVGGYLNAFTTEENTCFYSKACADRFSDLWDVLADMFLNSTFDTTEIEKERNVIKEELAMYLDQPQHHVQDLLNEALWPGQPLGRPLIGSEKTLDAIGRQELLDYKADNYVSESALISIAGNIEHKEAVEAVSKLGRKFKKARRPSFQPVISEQGEPTVTLFQKKIEQNQIAVGVRACSRHDEKRYALRLLNAILGENMSSRLFQVVREDHGLAYSICSSPTFFDDVGTITISAGVETEKMDRALELIVKELARLVEELPGKSELRRARDYINGQLDLSLENTENQMIWMGEHLLGYGNILSAAEVKQRLSEVTPSQIRSVAKEYFRPDRVTFASVGPAGRKLMRPIVHEISSAHSPESLVDLLEEAAGVVLLRTVQFDSPQSRYSFVTANPFLTFESFGSRCEITTEQSSQEQFGNPWNLLDALMSRYELLDDCDLPFPLGGCFGFWGYDLKNFVEPKLTRRAETDLELPDCSVGFYDSLIVFDHKFGKKWIVSTGLDSDGARTFERAHHALGFWRELLEQEVEETPLQREGSACEVTSNTRAEDFIGGVRRAQEYIRLGHIYQVNLSHRLEADYDGSSWEFYKALASISPAPFSAYLKYKDFDIVSSSPEQFLRLSGSSIRTRPIKGTRARDVDPTRDIQLGYELQTSPKENAELVMITDLLRNDLGRVCEYGTVNVPELVRLEKYSHVQHLVSTVEGRLRSGVSHFDAFASCFPGGSITGAPKFRAMEIIDELEPVSRGPYTGALGYLGFNRESQLTIIIRTAIAKQGKMYFNVGAGIVADSSPEAEYEETLAKGRAFMQAARDTAGVRREYSQ